MINDYIMIKNEYIMTGPERTEARIELIMREDMKEHNY